MADNYIVSARKYRPQTFDTVVGQMHITTTLKNAILHQHLAHAYLFCGPRGVGKTTCARILAKTINCERPTQEMEACGNCNSCQSFQSNASFNVFELDAASNNSVDDIRELVNQVRFAPQNGRYKIYIIDEVHMLSASAFNAFLKTLEEPPSYAIFILATTEKHKILPTILSRCQIFDFKRITSQNISDHLFSIATKEGMMAQEAALHVIAQKSEGCMRDALSMLDRIASFTNGQLTYAATMEHLNMLDADFYFKLSDNILAQDISSVLLLLNDVLERGFEGNVIIEGLSEHLRNMLLCKDQRMVKLLDIPNEHKALYFEKANQLPPSFIISALSVLNDCELNYKNSVSKRLHIEMGLIRLCYLLQSTKLDEKKNDSQQQISLIPEKTNAALLQPEQSLLKHQMPETVSNASIQSNHIVADETAVRDDGLQSNLSTHRRLSKSLLSDLDVVLNATTNNSLPEKKKLTQSEIEIVFENYKSQLQQQNKGFVHAQFLMVKPELIGSDEVKMVASVPFAEETIKEQRNLLIDFFSKQFEQHIRITTELRIDPNLNLNNLPKTLTRQELFEQMVTKNSELLSLKDALNLQLDF